MQRVDIPSVTEILERAYVVSLPMAVRFRGVDRREALLIDGPAGWGEFSPFLEYDAQESAAWLASGIESAFTGLPAPRREKVEVNGTVPAVEPEKVPEVLARFEGVRTFKVKVAEKGDSLDDDVARIAAVRKAAPKATIRADANRGYTVEQAIEAAQRFGPLDYLEQPVRTVDELYEVRMRLQRAGVFCRIAADESIRKAEDPLEVARRQAADVAVVKVAPLGGPRRTLEIAAQLHARHMDVTVSSELGTAVGINAGIATVAALPGYEDDDGLSVTPNAAGLGTQRLFEEDVTGERPLIDGHFDARPFDPDPARLEALAADAKRKDWWFERLQWAYEYL